MCCVGRFPAHTMTIGGGVATASIPASGVMVIPLPALTGAPSTEKICQV